MIVAPIYYALILRSIVRQVGFLYHVVQPDLDDKMGGFDGGVRKSSKQLEP